MINKNECTVIPAGAVICFILYSVLCAQIVTLIESQWLIIPPELQYSYYVEADDGRGIKIVGNSTKQGSCGITGLCYPLEEGAIVSAGYAVNYHSCRWYKTKDELGGEAGVTSISLYLLGMALLMLSWIVAITACCSSRCCGRSIYTVLIHLISLSLLLIASGAVAWLFTWHDMSCAAIYCNALPLDIGHCRLGWGLYVVVGMILVMLFLVITLCTLTRPRSISVQPKPRRLPIQVAERSGNVTGFMFAQVNGRENEVFRTNTAERSTARYPNGGPGVYGSVRLKEFYY